jgi:hypothetical protein
MLQTGMYVLYGPQPFEIWGMTLPWLFINGTAPLLGGLALYLFAPRLRGWRVLAVIPLIPLVQYAGWGLGLPLYWAMNAGCGIVITSIAGAVTMIAGAFVIDGVARFAGGGGRGHRDAWRSTPGSTASVSA